MRLQIGNEDIKFNQLVIYRDISQVYSTVEIALPGVFTQDFYLTEKQKTKYKILRRVFENNLYRYTLVADDVYRVLNQSCSAFTGVASVSSLLSRLGIKCNLKYSTIGTPWIIPNSKIYTLLEHLNNYAVVASGGASFFYIEMDGNVVCVDVKRSFDSSKAKDCHINVSEDLGQGDWFIKYPGEFNLTSYSASGTKSSRVSLDKIGSGNVRINDSTGYFSEVAKNYVSNMFWKRYYTSRTLSGTLTDNFVDLGDLVTIYDSGVTAVVTGITYFYNNMDMPPVLKIKLNCPWLK